MTDAGVLEVVELDEALDFDAPCDNSSCEKAAEWVGVPTCCGQITLRCGTHRRVLDDLFEFFQTYGFAVRHVAGCGRLTRAIRWEPLKGGGSDG